MRLSALFYCLSCAILRILNYPSSLILSQLTYYRVSLSEYSKNNQPNYNPTITMCVGSIVTINCKVCGSSTNKSLYLGCATDEHDREGWTARTDSIISRSTYNIPSCSSCPDSEISDSDSLSLKSVICSLKLSPTDEYDDEEYEDNASGTSTPYYSLGHASALTELWTEDANHSLDAFSHTMDSLIDRIIALPSTPAFESLKLNIFLIYSECDAYLQWTETEYQRVVACENTLSEVLNNTGVDSKVNANNVEDMTEEMMELFENLTSFHPFFDVEYNAGRFEGYLTVLEERLEKLESEN